MDTLQLAAAARYLNAQCAGQTIQGISEAAGGITLQGGASSITCIAHRAPLGIWLSARNAGPAQNHGQHPLQQRLKGFRIERIEVPWADRIVRIDCRRVHISKRVDVFSLIVECFGGRGNIALLDAEEQIRWAWRWDTLDGVAAPRFLPGIRYAAPESARSFAEVTADTQQWLHLMAPRYRPHAPAQQATLALQWAERQDADASWWQSTAEDGSGLVYPLSLPDWAPMQAVAPEAALMLHGPVTAAAPDSAKQRLQVEKKKLTQRIQKMHQDLRKWDAPEQYRARAYALFALPDAVSHATLIQATDHTQADASILEISLTPGRTLHQQAQQYMQKALRSQRAAGEIRRRLDAAEAQLSQLMERGLDASFLSRSLKKHAKQQGQPARAGAAGSAFHETQIEGFSIVWGNNARENDRLTFRVAHPWDFWFHVQDLGGSHVILRRENPGTAVPEAVLAAAAQWALQHSQSRAFSAEVDWTEVRHVQRKPGGGPGQVIYRHFQTIRVRRDG